jgi:hypothetical protein
MTTVKTFLLDSKPKCGQSLVVLDGISYSLTKRADNGGDGFVFSVEEPGKEKDQILLTKAEMKALYLLLATKAEKK